MKKNMLVKVKNTVCGITAVWAGIALVEYIVVLLPFLFPGILFDFFAFLGVFLIYGVYGVPACFFLSLLLIRTVRKKYKNEDTAKRLNIVTVVLSVAVIAITFLTDLNSRLQ